MRAQGNEPGDRECFYVTGTPASTVLPFLAWRNIAFTIEILPVPYLNVKCKVSQAREGKGIHGPA